MREARNADHRLVNALRNSPLLWRGVGGRGYIIPFIFFITLITFITFAVMNNLQIYKASAGSGKTYTLALEYIKELIINNYEEGHRRILAVTFTKDATGEMKDRILAELYGLAFETDDSAGFLQSLKNLLAKQGRSLTDEQIKERAQRALQHILYDYSHLNITTIDSFFQRVLRNLARELGASSRFNLEMNTTKVLSEAVNTMITNAKPNSRTLGWLITYIENKLDDDKGWKIEQDVLEFSRCIYNEYFQQHEGVLRKQLDSNPDIFKQIHDQQQGVIRRCRKLFKENGERYLALLDSNDLEPGDIAYGGELPILFNNLKQNPDKVEPSNRMLTRTEDPEVWAKKGSKRNQIISLAERELMPLLKETIEALKSYKTSRMIMRNLHQLGLVWDISKEISTRNKELNRFMLSDTSLFLNEMIDDSDAPFIYEKLGAEIQHVMIDEFQDTSRLQWENFKALLTDILARNNFSLLVGDVKQSIYRWRNGDWRILNGIEDELSATANVLPKNFRSEKTVVDFNNCFFIEAGKLMDTMYTNLTGESPSPFTKAYSEETVNQSPHKQEEAGYVSVDFIPKKDENENTYDDLMLQAVADKLLLLCENGVKADDICILARTNGQIVELGNYLASLRHVYPEPAEAHYFDLVSSEAFRLNSSMAVKIIIEAIRCLANPDDAIALHKLEFYLSLTAGIEAKQGVEELKRERERLERLPLFELVNHLILLFRLDDIPGQSPYLFTFQDALIAYLQDGKAGLADFLRYWNEDLSSRAIPAGEGVAGVRAMTIHKSKGLQFHTVLIPFCDWGLNPKQSPIVWCGPKENVCELELLPVSYNKGMDDTIFQEEYREETTQAWMDNLNVLYVAFTRAEKNLIVLAKEVSKIPKEPSTVSDLLWFSLGGDYETGCLSTSPQPPPKEGESESISSLSCGEGGGRGVLGEVNPLKQIPDGRSINYSTYKFEREGSIFKQSNQSYEFLYPERPSKSRYVAYGNIMHKLFEQINTSADVEKAIDGQITEGNIHPEERDFYIAKVTNAIDAIADRGWFSGKHTVFNECTILTEESGEVVRKRPDRVLLSAGSTQVIDFKFGQPHRSHIPQVKEYINLLHSMNYPNLAGYVWYVETGEVVSV